MSNINKPYNNQNIQIGMLFRAINPSETRLFCNDNYQYGLAIEKRFNNGTQMGGELLSGAFNPKSTIRVTHIFPKSPAFCGVETIPIGGKLMDGQLLSFAISFELLNELFELV